MNINSSESQADSAVAEEAGMSGDAVASLGDLRRLCQSSGISNQSLGTALNDFFPSDMSERVRVLSDLYNNRHVSNEILQYATEFFTRGGEDETISLLIVTACKDYESDVVLFLIDYSPSAVEYVIECRCEGVVEYKMPTLFEVLFVLSVNDALGVLNKLLDERLEFVRNARAQPTGNTLLHEAAERNDATSTEICRTLLQNLSELLSVQNNCGCTPLHNACLHVKLHFVKCALDNCPDAIHERSSRGTTPINYIFHQQNLTENPDETIELTRYLLEVDPTVASDLSRSTYPLTHVCIFTKEPYLNAGLEVIKLLYDAYPQALIIQELVVRRYIENGTIVNAVASFVNNQLHFLRLTSDAQLLTTPDDDSGNLPLHTALRRSRSISFGTIKYMVEKSPFSIQMPNDNGSLPLHIACAFHGCPNVAKYLLKHDRRSLFIANHEGDSPLHCACRAAKHDIITMIFSEYSNAPVATRNLKGELPIDLLLSCEEKESADFLGSLYLLIRADPEPERWMDDNAQAARHPHPLKSIGMALCSCFGCL